MTLRRLLLVAALAALAGAASARWCARADPAWRALGAPFVVAATALTDGGDEVLVRVRRVLRRAPGRDPRWPRRGRDLRLRIPRPSPDECTARFEDAMPLRAGRRYIVFAEMRDRRLLLALGPPLKESPKMRRRILRLLKDGIKPPKVEKLKSVTVVEGHTARFECRVSGRPPPRITWYINNKPVKQSALRRLRVKTFRRRSVLFIDNTDPSDSGRIECSAQGVEGPPTNATANLTVRAANTQTYDNKLSQQSSPCPMPNRSSYCLNGGTCLYFQQIGEQACRCPEGYEGHRCEIKNVSPPKNETWK